MKSKFNVGDTLFFSTGNSIFQGKVESIVSDMEYEVKPSEFGDDEDSVYGVTFYLYNIVDAVIVEPEGTENEITCFAIREDNLYNSIEQLKKEHKQ